MGFVSKIIKTTLMNIFDPGNGMSEGMDDLDEDMDEMVILPMRATRRSPSASTTPRTPAPWVWPRWPPL